MKMHSRIGSWILPQAAFPSASRVQRRKTYLYLEALERREVLSTFTWNGSAHDGNWDNGSNWVGGNAPTSGMADIILPRAASPQTITLHPVDVGLVFNSITVQGGSYTLQGPAGADHVLTVATGASIDTQNSSTLAICPNRLTGANANSISLNLLGGTTKTGTGKLRLNNDIVRYVSPQAPLQPFHVTGGTVTFGASVNMYQSLVQLDSGTTLVVSDQFKPSVGSLSGNGTLQIGVNAGRTAFTGLFFETPQGESDVFNGAINGPGGTLYMAGNGSVTIGSINTNQSGLFDVSLAAGTLLADGVINAHQLLVAGGATFGGPATMNFSGTVNFISGSTFAAVANGTAAGQHTQLTDTDTTDSTPVNLGGSTVSFYLGYAPARGDSYTIISAANGITGQFSNAANGQTISLSGVPFKVNASSTTFSLAVSGSGQTPEIQSESVLRTQRTNKKGRKVGKPVFQGFMLDFNTVMASSASNPVNYQVATAVTKRVHRKKVVVYQPVNFQLVYNAATNAVSLLVTGQRFLHGGQITVIGTPPNGVSDAAGGFLDGSNDGVGGSNAVFTILARTKGITRA
jgi:hypothetical protein